MKTQMLPLLCTSTLLALVACKTNMSSEFTSNAPPNSTNGPTRIKPAQGRLGTIEWLDPAFDQLLSRGSEMEKLAEGFDWSEGPVWMPGGYLLFSDVPMNTVYKWDARHGISEFLKPSGYTGATSRGGEPGSNGLTRDKDGRLVLCQHGDRRVARWEKDGKFSVIADRYQGKRFNSPNDVVFKSNGDVYFTDPPYGLVGNVNDPTKEIPFQGVYRVSKNGEVTLLTSEMSRPNGLAFSPDEKTLYVANSDPTRAIWMAFDVKADGTLGNGRVVLDVTPSVRTKKGLPDGMKVDRQGNLWATGPGGVLVISPQGKHLGTLATGEATANCAWGEDGTVLYITADMYLARIKTATKGAGF